MGTYVNPDFVVCSHLPVIIFNHPINSVPPIILILFFSFFFFPAPPGNQSSFHQWTVGAVYYSAIVLAEAFGTTNTSQIIDLQANGNNALTPVYAIYEQGALSKVAIINYMDDNQSGTNDLQVTIQVSSGVPQTMQVKYVVLFFFGWWFVRWLIFFFHLFIGICLLLLFRIEAILRGLVR